MKKLSVLLLGCLLNTAAVFAAEPHYFENVVAVVKLQKGLTLLEKDGVANELEKLGFTDVMWNIEDADYTAVFSSSVTWEQAMAIKGVEKVGIRFSMTLKSPADLEEQNLNSLKALGLVPVEVMKKMKTVSAVVYDPTSLEKIKNHSSVQSLTLGETAVGSL